jgi:putative nucleotidyltransferase with HDIG domain
MKASLQVYIALVVTTAVAFLAAVEWTPMFEMGVRDYAGLAVFVGLAILSEHLAVETRIRSSIAFLPLLAAATIFPASAIAVGVVITCVATGIGRNDWKAGAFNIAQLTLAYALAATVFAYLSGGVGVEGTVEHFVALFVPFYAAAATYFAINTISISAFIAIRDNRPVPPVVVDVTGKGGTNFIYDLLASPIALLIALLYSTAYVAGVVAFVLPMLLVRHSYAHSTELEQTNRDLLRVFVKAIETRDPYTSGHSQRVATLARAIGEDLGLPRRIIGRLEDAALLHDIGKIDAVYSEIISKEAALSPEERDLIQTHAVKGADILASFSSLHRDILVGVRHHHERYDGRGYPDGLKGKSIPLIARVIMICDAVDAMLSDRPYRKALSVGAVRQELMECAGSQFDPDIVDAMCKGTSMERAELLVTRSVTQAEPHAAAI